MAVLAPSKTVIYHWINVRSKTSLGTVALAIISVMTRLSYQTQLWIQTLNGKPRQPVLCNSSRFIP